MESQNEKDYMEIDLVEVFYILKKNLRNIFAVTLCCVLMATAHIFLQSKTPTYTSESLIRFKQMPSLVQANQIPTGLNANLEGTGAGSSNNITPLPYTNLAVNQRLATYAEILKSSAILASVNEAIEAVGTVKTESIRDTDLMKLSFSTSNVEKSQKGNELLIQKLQAYVAEKEHSETRYVISESTDAVKSGGGAVVEAIVTEKTVVEVINPPSSPKEAPQNRKRTLAVSALLGILFGSGYAVMRYLMNRKLTTRQDVEDYLGLPVIAVVPEERSLTEALARQPDTSVLKKIGGILWKEQN